MSSALPSCLICGTVDWELLDDVDYSGYQFAVRLCRRCGFVAQVPPLPSEALKAYYAANYNQTSYKAQLADLHITMKQPGRQRIAFLDGKNALAGVHRALEIGPGAGSLLSLLAERDIKVEAVEADPLAASWITDSLGFTVNLGSFTDVLARRAAEWRSNPFDLIVMVHVFEHMPDPVALLDDLRSIMSPGGRLFLEVPNIRRPFSDERKWQHYCDPGHLFYYSENSLSRVLNRGGWSVEALTDDTMRPYRNIYCLARFVGGRAAESAAPCDPPQDMRRTWRRFVAFHPVEWYARYGWKQQVRNLLRGSERKT